LDSVGGGTVWGEWGRGKIEGMMERRGRKDAREEHEKTHLGLGEWRFNL
jgi:hypothetical protein